MRGWGWGRSSLFFHRAAKAHREFTQQSYIRKDRSRNRGTDYEPEHLGRIFPHTLQSPSLGLIRSVWQNVVATTRGLRIHQRCTMLAVISIRHTHMYTHSRWSPLNINGGKFNNSSCIVSSFISCEQTLSQVLVWMNTQHTYRYIIKHNTNRSKTETDAYMCMRVEDSALGGENHDFCDFWTTKKDWLLLIKIDFYFQEWEGRV